MIISTQKNIISHKTKIGDIRLLRKSLLLHTIIIFVLLLPISIGIAGRNFLVLISILSLSYYFFRSVLDVKSSEFKIKWALTIYILLSLILPATWGFDFGRSFPLVTLKRLFFLILIISFFLNRKKINQNNNLPKVFIFSIGLLLFSYLLSTLFSMNIKVSAFRVLYFVVEELLLLIMVFNVYNNKESAKTGLVALCMVVLILGIFANIEKVLGVNHFEKVSLSGEVVGKKMATYSSFERFGIFGRVHSMSRHPITFGGILAILFPIILSFYLTREPPLKKVFIVILGFLCVEGVFLSVSRAPVFTLCFGIGLFFLFIIRKGKVSKVFNIVIVGILIFLLIVVFFLPAQELLLNTIMPGWEKREGVGGSSIELRLQLLDAAYNFSEKLPAWGIGYGAAASMVRSGFLRDRMFSGREIFWVECLLETGWIGISASLFFFLQVYIVLRNKYKRLKSTHDNMIMMGGIISFLCFIVFATITGEMGTFHILFISIPIMLRI